MRRSEKRQQFSIRKFNVGVASALIGVSLIGIGLPNQLAKADVTQSATTKTINARYVLTSELTAEEIKLIQLHLPSQTVDCTDDYYMVYRPTTTLPATGIRDNLTGLALGGGLLLVGIALGKNRKHRLVSSAFLVTATGLVGLSGVSAIQSQDLSAYNQTLTLKIGDQLPQLALNIANHEFMGYILVGDCDLTDLAAEPIAEQTAEPVSENQEVKQPAEIALKNQETEQIAPGGGAAAAGQEQEEVVSEPVQSETLQPIVEPVVSEEIVAPSEVVVQPSQPVRSEEIQPVVSEVIVEESQVVTSEVVSEVVVPIVSEVIVETVTSEISEVVVEEVTSEVTQVIDEETSEVSEVVVEVITSEISEVIVEVITSEVSEVIVEEIISEVSEVVVEEITSEVVSEIIVPVDSEVIDSELVEEPVQSEIITSETPVASEEVQSETLSEDLSEEENVQSEITSEDSELPISESEAVASEEIISENSPEPSESTAVIEESELTEDIESEVVVEVDKTALRTTYAFVQDLIEEDYSPETWAQLQVKLLKAEATLADDSVVQGTVDLAKLELDSALAALAVEKIQLKNLLAESKEKVATDYSPDSWRDLLAALTKAQSVFDDADSKQSAVNQQTAILRAALNKLTVDKSELVKLLNQVSSLAPSDYSTTSWSNLLVANDSSSSVNADTDAVQSTVDQSVVDLQTALDQLGVDKSELENLLLKAKALTATDYSPASWSVLDKVQSASDLVNKDDKAVQSAINQAASELDSALKQLTVDKSELTKLLAKAEELLESDYSPSTWKVLITAKSASDNVHSDTTAVQSTVDQSVAALQTALDQLGVDKSELENLLTKAKSLTATDYSSASWSVLDKVQSASELVNRDDKAVQSAINQAASELDSALKQLTVDKSELTKLLAKVEQLLESDYSPSTWEVFTTAKTSSDKVKEDTTAVQSTVDQSVADLQTALDQLGVDKSELENLLSEAKSLTATDFSSTSWSVLNKVQASSDLVNKDDKAVQSAINQAASELDSALKQLTVDKSELTKLLAKADELLESDYSPSTWEVLSTAKSASELVNKDAKAVQSAINQAASELDSALKQLTVDKEELTKLLAKAEELLESDYSPSTWEVFTTAKTSSDKVKEDTTAVQSTVDQSVVALQTALDQLGVDKSELENLLTKAKSLTATDYSSASWSVLDNVQAASELVNKDDKAVQSVINQSASELDSALKQLTVDTKELEDLLNQAKALEETAYRPKTWSVLADEVTSSNALLSSPNLKQSAINQAVEELQVAIDQLALRLVPPTLVYDAIETDAMDKSLTVIYHLEDKDETLTGVTFALYDGEELVAETTVDVADGVTATLPYYDTDYRLETRYTYDLQEGDGIVEEKLEEELVSIELKKIEIKDIDSLTLYRFDDASASYNRVSTLASVPTETDDYFVLIQSDIYKDMLLPVSNIEETATSSGATAYKVQVDLDELVQDMDDSAVSDYVEQFSFTIGQTPEAEENVITNFNQLVAAIENNPQGTYYLGANLFADDVDLSEGQQAYISRFEGQLIGEHNGQQYSIYNLSAPLFEELYTAKISHLDLKSVKISTTEDNAAALAIGANGSQFKDISVSGQIIARNKVAGLVAEVAQSLLEDVSFQGQLIATARDESISIGGIAANAANTAIRKASADVSISAYSDTRLSSAIGRVGAIAGYVINDNALYSIEELYQASHNIENATATGVINYYGQGANVGGIVGSTLPRTNQTQGTLHNVLSAVDVNGGYHITGLVGNSSAVSQAYVVAGTEGRAQAYEVTTLSDSEAEATRKAMAITTSLEDSLLENSLNTDYTSLRKAEVNRETAYNNIARLMPFYNKEQVVKYGNKVASDDKLYNTEILSVTPMVAGDVVADLAMNKEAIDHIMIHYADGTVEYRPVAYSGDFKNTAISEYTIDGTDLIYTPESFLSTYDGIINAVAPLLKAMDYKSEEVALAIGAYTDQDVASLVAQGMTEADARAALAEDNMDLLYLEAAFAYIQDDVETFLRQILSTSNSVNTTGGVVDKVLVDYIVDNKEKLLMGLSYVIRWYDINFGETNIENLAAYYQNFFGKPVNTLEWLVSIADMGYDNLRLANNLTTYAQSIAPNNAYGHLLDYLTAHRELFTDYETDNDWFKETTTAYIQEVASELYPDEDVSVYNKLAHPEQANGILPLLTASEGIYLISTMTTLTYGMFASYMDMDLAETDPAAYQEALDFVKSWVDYAAQAQGKHQDAMSAIFDDFKDMPRVLPVWDAYLEHGTDQFIDLYGADATQAMLDFFGPIERAETQFEEGTGAYALTNDNMLSNRGEAINFVKTRLLSDYGLSIYTHELVHVLDRIVYLNSEGRRSGQDPESYATGLLESLTDSNDAYFGFNTIHDWSESVDDTDRYGNVSPTRFQSFDDLQAYASGVLDVIYLLDVAEANAVIASGTSTMSNWYRKLYNTNATGQVLERLRSLTPTELASIKTWEDLVTTGVVDRRTPTNLGNRYYQVPLFSSNYAALLNDQGTTAGQLTFRRLAYEILAATGKDGFVAYTSDLHMGDDSFILDELNSILGTSYSSYAEFKTDQIQKRVDQSDRLAEVAIDYLGQTVTITDFDQLQELMAEAVAYDRQSTGRLSANNTSSRVYQLKSAIYNAYLRQTDDFSTSIFK